MAQLQYQLNQEVFCCSICLDLLNDPVTTSCGHSYCRICLKSHWDKEEQKGMYTCPYCSQFFIPRPVLGKNTMLADLVEEMKKTGLQAAPAGPCYAGSADVACDICTGRKLKAQKSCLQCMASFCEEHLQPHLHAAPFKKHKLVEPSMKLQENICSLHDEVMKMFCRTDQQSICYLCSVDQHKGHDTVSAAAERTERQRELQGSRQNIQLRIQQRERDVKLLQQEVNDINVSADKAVEHSEKIFTELIRLLEQRRSDAKQQVRSQQQTEVSRVRELQEKLEQEITELKRRDNGLERLVYIEDHNQFLQDYHSLSQVSESPPSYSISKRPLRFFEDVTAAVSKAKLELQEALREKTTTLPQRATKGKLELPEALLNTPKRAVSVAVLPPKQETTSRATFLQYSRNITLDPNTAYKRLLVYDWDKKVKILEKKHSYPRHADRFKGWYQVLSRESLFGRCYWEVECGEGVYVAVAYKSISRAGGMAECAFGHNSKSWALFCSKQGFNYMHMNVTVSVSGPRSSKIGVFLDTGAGILSFYSVSETMTLLHKVQTTFTEPLHAGIRFFCSGVLSYGSTAELCELR